MAKITLGGERIGSGKKMEVDIPEFGRSSHDQGFVFTTDQAFGTLVPVMCQIGTRGDVAYINEITSLVRTLPTDGPVFGSVKQQIDVFAAPVRLYIGALHNNMTGIGLKMNQIKFPVTKHKTTVYAKDWELKDPCVASVSKSSLSAYLGSVSSRVSKTDSNYNEMDIFKLFYWDIYKNYYANKQEEEGVVISSSISGQKVVSIQMIGEPLKPGFTIENNGESFWSYGEQAGYEFKSGTTLTFNFETGTDVSPIQNGDLNKMGVKIGKSFTPDFTSTDWIREDLTSSRIKMTYSGAKVITFEGPDEKAITVERWVMPEEIKLERFPLENIDKMREAILGAPIGTPLVINEVNGGMAPYNTDTKVIEKDEYGIKTKREARSMSMCGLGIKCHLSDMFNNWLQTDWIDGENGINELTSIDTSNGKFTVNEFILDYKLFKMMNRIAISDGTYDAWQTAVYGQEGRVMTESPVYCGGYSSEIAFDEVVSSAATQDEALGSLAGRGAQQNSTRKGGKNIKIKCDEAMLIMAICSFTPRVTYSQGQQWWTQLESMDDLHKPDLDGIAFQNLNTGSMAGWTIKVDGSSPAVGKQTSWIHYTTEVNHTFGSFAPGGPLEHMVINRVYKANPQTGELVNATTYIDPTEFNVIFADAELSAKPFWVQIGIDLTMRRKMSAVQIPNL